MSRQPLLLILSLAGLLLVAACAPLQPPPVEEQPEPDDEAAEESGTAAVVALIGQARQAYEQGQYQSSIAKAERGLRIDRREAELYLLLAQSYERLDQPDQARQFARQGLRYAPPDSPNYRALERLLEAEDTERRDAPLVF